MKRMYIPRECVMWLCRSPAGSAFQRDETTCSVLAHVLEGMYLDVMLDT